MENKCPAAVLTSESVKASSLVSVSPARRPALVSIGAAPLPEQAGQRGAKNSRRRPGYRLKVGAFSLDPWAVASLSSLGISYVVLADQVGIVSAVGVLGIIGVHEMGHILAARWFDVHMHWPIFVPLMGAFVTGRGEFSDPYKNACIGIGGPLAGVVATVILHWAAIWCGSADLKAVARFSYGVHLFNLIPAGILDGGHIAEFVGRWLWVPGALLLSWMVFQMRDSKWYTLLMFALVMVPAIWRAMMVVLRWCGSAQKITPVPGMGVRRAVMLAVALTLVAVCALGLSLLVGIR